MYPLQLDASRCFRIAELAALDGEFGPIGTLRLVFLTTCRLSIVNVFVVVIALSDSIKFAYLLPLIGCGSRRKPRAPSGLPLPLPVDGCGFLGLTRRGSTGASAAQPCRHRATAIRRYHDGAAARTTALGTAVRRCGSRTDNRDVVWPLTRSDGDRHGLSLGRWQEYCLCRSLVACAWACCIANLLVRPLADCATTRRRRCAVMMTLWQHL